MCVIALQANHFVFQPPRRLIHQVAITLMPQLISMSQCAWHRLAVRFNSVLAKRLGAKRRQFAMPVNNPWTYLRSRFYTLLIPLDSHSMMPPLRPVTVLFMFSEARMHPS
jgi:hypothetical protein